MQSNSPAIRALADSTLLPQTTFVFGSLAAAGWIAGYATAAGSTLLIAASFVSILGPLVGLRYIDEEARKLEATHD